jgi:uncharacterized protein YneF (UPF0154 family)
VAKTILKWTVIVLGVVVAFLGGALYGAYATESWYQTKFAEQARKR